MKCQFCHEFGSMKIGSFNGMNVVARAIRINTSRSPALFRLIAPFAPVRP